MLSNDYGSYLWWHTIPELRFMGGVRIEYVVTALEHCTYDPQQLGYAFCSGLYVSMYYY